MCKEYFMQHRKIMERALGTVEKCGFLKPKLKQTGCYQGLAKYKPSHTSSMWTTNGGKAPRSHAMQRMSKDDPSMTDAAGIGIHTDN